MIIEILSPNKKNETQKSEIANLLNSNFKKKSYNKNQYYLDDICDKEKISKFHFFSKSSAYENENRRSNSRNKNFMNSGALAF
jgi:hypothetical protein